MIYWAHWLTLMLYDCMIIQIITRLRLRFIFVLEVFYIDVTMGVDFLSRSDGLVISRGSWPLENLPRNTVHQVTFRWD